MPRPRSAPPAVPVRGWVLLRAFGVELAVHPSWLVAFGVVALVAYDQVAPELAPGASGAARWALAALFPIVFAVCVLLHELSHAVTARAYGLDARRITLFMFGGVASIGSDSPSPRVEFNVAIAGPLVSLLLASTFAAGSRLAPAGGALSKALDFVAVVNLALTVFNLIPGFPLDGGRILRSALWAGWRDRARATRFAAYGGRALALVLMGAGAAVFLLDRTGSGFLPGAWWVMLGWFLYGATGNAARNEGGAHPRDRIAGAGSETAGTGDAGGPDRAVPEEDAAPLAKVGPR